MLAPNLLRLQQTRTIMSTQVVKVGSVFLMANIILAILSVSSENQSYLLNHGLPMTSI